jgi:Ca-activated chloride channel family protein
MQERARQDVAEGKFKEATRRLQNIATHLLSQGNHELALAILSEADHIQENLAFSEEGEKRIKYGTRGLLLPVVVKEKTE